MKQILHRVTQSIHLLINLKAASLKVTSEGKSDRLILIPSKRELISHQSTLQRSVVWPFTHKENSRFGSPMQAFLPLQELNALLILSLHTSIILPWKDLYIGVTLPKCPTKSPCFLGLERSINYTKHNLVYNTPQPEKAWKAWVLQWWANKILKMSI